MVAAGHNNAAIAAQLALAPKTVRNHISNIMTKLAGLRPRAGHHPGTYGRLGLADPAASRCAPGTRPI